MSAEPAYVHIGLPKTGTTHLQNVLWHNRDRLAGHGILYPGNAQRAHFAAAMDLQGSQLPGVPGSWKALVDEVAQWPGKAVVSHELFAWASAEQVAQVVSALAPREVHVIVTLRDFSRIVSATWQERAKNRQVERWPAFLEQVGRGPEGGHAFWRLQDAPAILSRWAREVPPERVHVVTVPPLGADPHLLVRRFGQVVGFSVDDLVDPPPKANESLGAVEVALLQRINRASRGRLDWDAYRRLVKQRLVPDTLASRSGQLRVVLPESSRGWVEAETRRTADTVRSLGCDVVGDLDELAPTGFGGDGVRTTSSPDAVPQADVMRAAGDLVVDLLLELERLRGELRRARGRTGAAHAGDRGSGRVGTGQLSRMRRRGRQVLLGRSRANRGLRVVIAGWRRVRGRGGAGS
jgi:hypothetical protein